MAEVWTGLGDDDSDQEAARGRSRMWEEEWEEEEDDEVEENEEDSQLSLKALRVLDRLKDLDCPFLEGLYITGPKTIKQFLCRPSLYRLVILEWLFARLYPSFGNSFETVSDSGAKEKITELTRLGHELMLCGPDDQDLIEGSAGMKEQLYFFNHLIDLVTSLGPEYATNFFSMEESFHNLLKNNKMLLKKVFIPHHHKEILDPKLSPLPPDIGKENLYRMPPESKKTKMEELSEKLTKLSEMLQTSKQEGFTYQDGVNRLFLPNATRPPVQSSPHRGKITSQGNSTLGLTLSDFHQLVIAFVNVFEDELQKHCNRAAPNISPCSPFFQSAYETLNLLSQELKVVIEVLDLSAKVEAVAEKPQREKAYLGAVNCMMTFVEKMKELNQKHELFQERPLPPASIYKS